MPASSSTLPALGVATGREPPPAQHGIVEKEIDEDDSAEGSTLLPPIGKAGGLKPQRQGKDKEKAKALKAAANATLRTSSNNFSAGEGGQGAAAVAQAVAAHGLGGSKGFERAGQERRNDPLGNSYGNKFKQTAGGAGQASAMGQSSNFGNQGAPVQERRDPKGGQMPRQYVS